jgi:hypothetical protein
MTGVKCLSTASPSTDERAEAREYLKLPLNWLPEVYPSAWLEADVSAENPEEKWSSEMKVVISMKALAHDDYEMEEKAMKKRLGIWDYLYYSEKETIHYSDLSKEKWEKWLILIYH